MISLRYYQGHAIALLREGFKDHQRQVLCLPTGAGKTVVFSEMVRLANQKGTCTIVFTDRTELFKQTIASLGKVGVPVEEISPSNRNVYTSATVFLAMVETIKRRENLLQTLCPKLLIIDEAHKGNFTRIMDLFPDARVIGATATPVGKHFPKYYQNIIQNIDVPELVSEGFLVDCRPFKMVDDSDLSNLEVKRGEFTDFSLNLHFNKPTIYNGMIKEWARLGGNAGAKTIVFNCNIEHTVNTHKAFIEAGYSSQYITSKTPKDERDEILRAYSSGSFQVLNNCGILTTGYDEPSIEFVVMNRATMSLPLWLQCVGRGSRPIDGSIGQLTTAEQRIEAIAASKKPRFTLLDCGGNHDRLGMWNEARDWNLKEKKKRDGVAPVKTCPKCESMLTASATSCKFCGYVFPIKESPPVIGKAVEINHTPSELRGRKISDLSIDELIQLQRSGKYKPSFIWRVVRSNGENDVRQYAQKMGYRSGWVRRQIDEIDNANYKDYTL